MDLPTSTHIPFTFLASILQLGCIIPSFFRALNHGGKCAAPLMTRANRSTGPRKSPFETDASFALRTPGRLGHGSHHTAYRR